MVSHARSKATLFCECSSIRGMQKIIKARTKFLRSLWILFVFTMTTVLIVTSVFLVLDYLNYDTAWHNSKRIDDRPPFPSITVCSHNPFSRPATDLWREGRVFSPTQFSRRLLNMSMRGINKPAAAAKRSALASASLFDKIETYYQTLKYNESVLLGHDRSMMRYCMIVKDGFNMVSENCTEPDRLGMRLKPFSHMAYLNCWTLEPVDRKTAGDIEKVIILIAITPSKDINELKHNFVIDMLGRGEGLKLTIHPNGEFPDIVRNGMSVEPGKMNEFTYDTTEWRKLSTPKVRCHDDQESIVDMGTRYNYSLKQCLDSVMQRHLMRNCSCINADWPRIRNASDSLPYCMDLKDGPDKWDERVTCAIEVFDLMRNITREAQGRECFKKCSRYEYNVKPSITVWNPSASKLDILTSRYRNFETWYDALFHSANRSLANDLYRRALLLNQSSINASAYTKFLTEDRFSFVKLSRRNFDLELKVEKLVFDLNILASRIGGLCSLCIGLTTAFVIEIVEFMYLYFQMPAGGGADAAGQGQQGQTPTESVGKASNAPLFTSEQREPREPRERRERAPKRPDCVTHRSRAFAAHNHEDEAEDMLGLAGYQARNHYGDSPWYRQGHGEPCHACGRGLRDATPISSV